MGDDAGGRAHARTARHDAGTGRRPRWGPDYAGGLPQRCELHLPDGGPFICPDEDYTTGNLGKTWNELDLVPYRITLQAGNSAPANQQYTLGWYWTTRMQANPDMTSCRPRY